MSPVLFLQWCEKGTGKEDTAPFSRTLLSGVGLKSNWSHSSNMYERVVQTVRAGGRERKKTTHLTEWSEMAPQKEWNESGS